MFISREDARSDVILAGATTLFGGIAVGLVASLPLYPRQGVAPVVLGVVWLFALTGLVPVLLARYRGDGVAAFGLDGPRIAWTTGLVLVVPVAALGLLRVLEAGGTSTEAVLGRIGGAGLTTTLLGGAGAVPGRSVLMAAQLAAVTLGALLLTTFLSIRGAEAFRSDPTSLTGLVRTFAVGAAVVALGLGALRSLGPPRLLPVVMNVVALVVLALLADRLVPAGTAVPRSAVLTPAVVVVVTHVFATGGLFRGDLLAGLYTGALGAGTVTVVAALAQLRARAWATVPLLLALHWWPSCLSPLAIELAAAGC